MGFQGTKAAFIEWLGSMGTVRTEAKFNNTLFCSNVDCVRVIVGAMTIHYQ